MNIRHKKFVDEYIICGNATKAYMDVYKAKNRKTAQKSGSKLLQREDVKEYLERQLEEIHNEKTADAKEVLEYLTSVMRGEQKEEVLKWIGEGIQEVTKITVSNKDRIKAGELLGKRYRLFSEKIDIEASANIVFVEDLKE